MKEPNVHVGTSGWHYTHWIGPFYPEGMRPDRMLAYYAERFDIVEMNNTFYRLPSEASVAAWGKQSPGNFRFALKASRYLTHMKKLKDPEPGLKRFFERVRGLKSKMGPIVFQLPPHWGFDGARLNGFLEALPPRHRYAFEFRNPDWNRKEALRLLSRHNAAYCIFDLAGFQSPLEITADFTYIRLHGPGDAYQGSYSTTALRGWASRIRDWKLKSTFVFFDNDQAGFAPTDALRLKEMVGQ